MRFFSSKKILFQSFYSKIYLKKQIIHLVYVNTDLQVFGDKLPHPKIFSIGGYET